MNRRHTDTALRAWLRDPWRQTDLFIFGVIAPAVLLIYAWRVA